MATVIPDPTAGKMIEMLEKARDRMDNWGSHYPRADDCERLENSVKQISTVVEQIVVILNQTQSL